jgi:hypothetical protein
MEFVENFMEFHGIFRQHLTDFFFHEIFTMKNHEIFHEIFHGIFYGIVRGIPWNSVENSLNSRNDFRQGHHHHQCSTITTITFTTVTFTTITFTTIPTTHQAWHSTARCPPVVERWRKTTQHLLSAQVGQTGPWGPSALNSQPRPGLPSPHGLPSLP